MVRIDLGDKVKALDMFGEQVQFKVNGKDTHRTYIGALISFFVIVITFIYALQRYDVMLERGDTVYTQNEEPFIVTKDTPLT